MQLGLVYPQIELGGDPDAVRTLGRGAEELGYDYLLAYDHVVGAEHADREPALWGPYTENDPFHDPFVLFAYLAGLTEKLEFASGVIILPQRQTVLVAKQAADLDLLSGERFRMGVGVGWNYVEYEALGQDFATRGARANEQIEFMRRLWSEPLLDWKGEFDQIERGNVLPQPKRQIPIWVGGFSPPAFRRGAAMGDGFMFAGTLERTLPGLAQVNEMGAANGRDMENFGRELVRTNPKQLSDTVDELRRWRDLGGTHFAAASMGMGLDSAEAHLDYFAQVMDAAKN
ncbi:LLM class F420-dependent oxidoreductase [Acidimicrobiales bacterium]|nr:LLM class F420-dependent oxidoreductase [Acidimicrobiaceae bacterium]MDB4102906.1 LLM class F420-dependent oxidoreductase [Acidimicrobiales bacterium]